MDEVVDATVIAGKNESGEKYLIAFVVGLKVAHLSAIFLGQRLANFLPDFMIPSETAVLNELPKMPTGKVDTQALSTIQDNTRRRKNEYVARRDDLENHLKRLWEKVLKRTDI